MENCTPEQERQLALVIEPDLAPTVDKGADALDWLGALYTKISKLSKEASAAAIKDGRVKTSPKRASAPNEVGAA